MNSIMIIYDEDDDDSRGSSIANAFRRIIELDAITWSCRMIITNPVND